MCALELDHVCKALKAWPINAQCCLQEIQALAGCRCNNITEYYASAVKPGSTELMIVMELMSCSVADVVSSSWKATTTGGFVIHGCFAIQALY